MSNHLVTINLVVLNGEKYIRHCLDGVLEQTYLKELIEFNILDNGSSDRTKEIIKEWAVQNSSKFTKFNLVELTKNVGVWPGQEELLKHSMGKYVLGLWVDVILDKDFIKNAVEVMERESKIGALQAKVYKYDLSSLPAYRLTGLPVRIIDTCGFKIFKSRRLINIGHGETDDGQFNEEKEIFGIEGAAPFFRKEAMESCRISLPAYRLTSLSATTEIFDHDYFWYGDDFDIVWRMNLFGWKQVFAPTVIAWHDRQTTKKLRSSFKDFLEIRRAIPLKKRKLEWKNIRFTIIKNDYIINVLKDLPYILKREVMMFVYLLIFEPKVFAEIPEFLKILPKIIRKRKEIMKKAVRTPAEMHKFFQ